MKAEVRELWLAALEGDEYTQGYGALIDRRGRHCCLGVLCEVYKKETGKEWESLLVEKQGTLLPDEVEEWSGLYHSGDLEIRGKELWKWNDFNQYPETDGKDFKGIADLIREAEL